MTDALISFVKFIGEISMLNPKDLKGNGIMFNRGDIVLYGSSGICEIGDITTVDIPGVPKDKLFYILYQKSGNAKIYVAVDGNTSKMRKLISKAEAMKLIDQIADIEPLKVKDKKKPEAEYKEALQKYDCTELIKLIKCLYFRKQQRLEEGKKATAADEKYMKSAEEVLYQELGVVLDIPKDQVLDFIFKKIDGE